MSFFYHFAWIHHRVRWSCVSDKPPFPAVHLYDVLGLVRDDDPLVCGQDGDANGTAKVGDDQLQLEERRVYCLLYLLFI